MKGKLKIEKAPSSRARCHNCGEYIEKGKYRVLEVYQTRFTVKDKFCAGCGSGLIRATITELEEMLKTLTKAAKDVILNEE